MYNTDDILEITDGVIGPAKIVRDSSAVRQQRMLHMQLNWTFHSGLPG